MAESAVWAWGRWIHLQGSPRPSSHLDNSSKLQMYSEKLAGCPLLLTHMQDRLPITALRIQYEQNRYGIQASMPQTASGFFQGGETFCI